MEEVTKEEAVEALKALLWELPTEFSGRLDDPEDVREFFSVIKKSNVRRIHVALVTLQEYFEILPKVE